MVRVKKAYIFSAEKKELYRTSLVFPMLLLRYSFALDPLNANKERTKSEGIAKEQQRRSGLGTDLERWE